MGLVGYEIVQSRTFIDPNNPAPPNLNYKLSFPITVFDAVRRDMMDENSETLTQVIEKISQEIKSKQSIIPAKPANYLITYAGVAGAVGSIQMSKEIPWDSEKQSNSKIPTEKAVGDFIRNLGIDPNNPDKEISMRWSDIIGRPNIYNSLGNDVNGIINQAFISKEINAIKSKIENTDENYNLLYTILNRKVSSHVSDEDNPHHITISKIGAAGADSFNDHTSAINPHNITKHTVGLGNVNNTSDMDKPISKATQEAIDAINKIINTMTDDVGELSFITKIEYNPTTGSLDLIYRNGSVVTLDSPIEESIKEVTYDSNRKELVTTTHAGFENRISVADLYVRYIGSLGTAINIEIDGNQISGNQIIKAIINPKSIRSNDIADDAIVGRNIKDLSIGGIKIRDLSIGSNKLADQSITSEKIARHSISNDNIAPRVIDGRTLFSSSDDNRILATVRAGQNPVWTQVSAGMIGYDAVQSINIMKYAVTHDKIAQDAVGTSNIEDTSITTSKVANGAINSDKLSDKSVTSEKLASNLTFEGITKINSSPKADSDCNEIVDTHWVREFAKNDLTIDTSHIIKRSVTGEKLFSSPVRNRILAVLKANQDPVWTTINNEMMEENSIGTSNIMNSSITTEKLTDKIIQSKHLNKSIVQANHIEESAVTSEKIYKSHEANRVLAVLSENGHPTYSQVTQDMMAPNSIGTKQLIDGTITPSKLSSSDVGQQVMAVGLRGSIPIWSKIMTQMISDRAIDGSKLFTSDKSNVILGITRDGTNSTWMKLIGDMIEDRTIKAINIGEKAIKGENLDDNTIESRSIKENAILSKHILPGAIKPELLETSPMSGRVIGVSGLPYSTPMWTQVNTSMIEDNAITKEKIYKSNYPYRVLGATQAGTSPEYLMITHQFIVDGTIIPEKLARNFVLFGTPELTVSPSVDSNSLQLANTSWVRNLVDKKMVEFLTGETIPGWPPKFDFDDIPEHGIDGSKLFTHPYGPRVLGITEPNGEVEFILIESDLIVNGAVTSEKIQRSVHLYGSPMIEVRPSPNASDDDGNGHQIPDCQWVLDRIADVLGGSNLPGTGSGSTPAIIPQGSVTTNHIQNRAVTGEKIFTSIIPNRLIGVTGANSTPVYLQANNEMIATRAVDGRTLFSSDVGERILGVHSAGDDPMWTQVSAGMIGNNAIQNRHISERAINESQIGTGAVSSRTLASKAIIDNIHIFDHAISKEKIRDNAVSTEKIIDQSITTSKIKDKAITGNKLEKEIVLPKNSTIENSRNYEQRSIRNITISPNKPTGGRNGDIWFKFS